MRMKKIAWMEKVRETGEAVMELIMGVRLLALERLEKSEKWSREPKVQEKRGREAII